MLEFNVPGGKLNRGMAVLDVLKALQGTEVSHQKVKVTVTVQPPVAGQAPPLMHNPDCNACRMLMMTKPSKPMFWVGA